MPQKNTRPSTGHQATKKQFPTGNLDAKTGGTIIELMLELNRTEGTTLVLVTHDHDIARLARQTLRLSDGCIVGEQAIAS